MSERVWRVRDVATYYALSARTVHRYIASGLLRATKLQSGHWRIADADMRALLQPYRSAQQHDEQQHEHSAQHHDHGRK